MKNALLASIWFGALVAGAAPAMAQAAGTYDGSTQISESPGIGSVGSISQQIAMIQAEAQAQVARSTAAAAVALKQLDDGPVHPEVVKTPAGVTIAAPKAPEAKPLPNFDYSKLPPELARPGSIRAESVHVGPYPAALKKL